MTQRALSLHGEPSLQQDILLYLYDDLAPARRAELEAHFSTCDACRAERDGFGRALATIDRASLRDLATVAEPLSWTELRRRLVDSADAGRVVIGPWSRRLLQAAAVLAVAAASFAAGRQWDSIPGLTGGFGRPASGQIAGLSGDETGGELDDAARLEMFSARTNGYLKRSRLVLLAFSNAGGPADAVSLRDASFSLLKETRAARQMARQLGDERIESLLSGVEKVFREISGLSEPGDPSSVERIRAEVNDSGLLDQLEVLADAAPRRAQERQRT